ncbi:hypothetical protein D3C71_1136310 [compost metagenome]
MRGHRAHDQRVAVGRRLGHQIGADVAARARPVFHDHGLAERTAHLFGQHAGHGVQRAAGRVRDDEADRLGREIGGLGQRGCGERQGGGKRHGALQQGTADRAVGGFRHNVVLLNPDQWRSVAYRSPGAGVTKGYAADWPDIRAGQRNFSHRACVNQPCGVGSDLRLTRAVSETPSAFMTLRSV